MRYYGGKGIYGHEIANILKSIMIKYNINNYLEPFCGALGVAKHMKIDLNSKKYNFYANDIAEDLIMLWTSVKNNKFKDPKMTKKKWITLKESNKPSAEKAFAGYGCSFSGIYFGSYLKGISDTVFKNLYRYDISHLNFFCNDYKNLEPLIKNGGFLIYCDGPYGNTDCTPFERSNSKIQFDINEFWLIMNRWSKMNNIIVVSEFSAPEDWNCIWEKKRKNKINVYESNVQTYFVEKLFIKI